MLQKVKNLAMEEDGQALTEYGLILSLIVIGVIAILTTLGGDVSAMYSSIADKFKTTN